MSVIAAAMISTNAVMNAPWYPPVIVTMIEVITGPSICPPELAMFKIPRSLAACSLFGSTSTFSA